MLQLCFLIHFKTLKDASSVLRPTKILSHVPVSPCSMTTSSKTQEYDEECQTVTEKLPKLCDRNKAKNALILLSCISTAQQSVMRTKDATNTFVLLLFMIDRFFQSPCALSSTSHHYSKPHCVPVFSQQLLAHPHRAATHQPFAPPCFINDKIDIPPSWKETFQYASTRTLRRGRPLAGSRSIAYYRRR